MNEKLTKKDPFDAFRARRIARLREEQFRREHYVPLAEELFPEVAARLPDFPAWISLIFQVMQGLGLVNATLPSDSETDLLRERTLALFKGVLRDAFAADVGSTRK